MRESDRDHAKYRMERARESIAETTLLMEHGHYRTALARLYYACFYAASALLLAEERESSKHTGILALFGQNFVKTGRFPRELYKAYARLFDERMKADYEDHYVPSMDTMTTLLNRAEAFVDEAARSLDEF